MSIHTEASAERARAWVYLLGAWHSGDAPSTREVRRVTGFGQGRADKLVADVLAWAIANGARFPAKPEVPPQGAEQGRSGVGAGAEQADYGSTPDPDAWRSAIGADSEQDRSVSCARDLPVERDVDGEAENEQQQGAETPPAREGSIPYPPAVLFPGIAPATIDAPPAPDPIDEAWTALVAWTPKPAAWKLSPARRTSIKKLVKQHGIDAIHTVARWMTSDHDRARFLRERGDADTLIRPANFATYLALAETNHTPQRSPAQRGAPVDYDALYDQFNIRSPHAS